MEANVNLSNLEFEAPSKVEVADNLDNDRVLIKNTKDGQLIAVPLSEVANLYGFEAMDECEQIEVSQSPEVFNEAASADEEELLKPMHLQPSDMEMDQIEQKPQTRNGRFFVQKIFKWDEEKTEYMLEEYEAVKNSIGAFKRFKIKKDMWTHIANKLSRKFNVTLKAKQIESRMRCLQKRKHPKGRYRYDVEDTLSSSGDEKFADTLSNRGRFLKKSDVIVIKPPLNSIADPYEATGVIDITSSELSSSPPMSPVEDLNSLFQSVNTSPSLSPSPVPSLSPSITPPPPDSSITPSSNKQPISKKSPIRIKPSSHETTKSSSAIKFSSASNVKERTDETLINLMEQINANFSKYFEMQERRDKEKRKERRRYTDSKLKILRDFVSKYGK